MDVREEDSIPLDEYLTNLKVTVAEAENRKRERIDSFNTGEKGKIVTQKAGSVLHGFVKLEPWQDCVQEKQLFAQPVINSDRNCLKVAFKPT